MPDKRWTKFNATRSALNSARAWPVREVFRMIAEWTGAEIRGAAGGGSRVAVLAMEKGGNSAAFFANLSRRAHAITCNGLRMRLRPWAVIKG